MALNKIDFFSNAPKNFIFQNTSNKTNFGGALFLIYIFIVLIIATFYLASFFTEDTYSIEYSHYEKLLSEEDNDKYYNNEKYNPYFDFIFRILDTKNYPLNDENIVLMNNALTKGNKTIIEIDEIEELKFSDINMGILYKCKNEDCEIPFNNFYLKVIYQGFIINHQNKSAPIYRQTGKHVRSLNIPIFIDEIPMYKRGMKLIKYKEEAGFLKLINILRGYNEEDKELIALEGEELEFKSFYFLINNKNHTITIDSIKYKLLGSLSYYISFSKYDEYKRKEKNILDPLSNICSLSITLFHLFAFILTSFYSNNFDNYKIIDKILLNANTINYKSSKSNISINLKNNTNKNESLLSQNNINENTNKINDENINDYNSQNTINYDNDDNNNKKLPKLRFYEYFYNNIYCKCCKKNNNQEIISKCNEIISKYFSIEYILYNQIKLDNLFKDYRWNDPALNNYDNNELIIELYDFISLCEILD